MNAWLKRSLAREVVTLVHGEEAYVISISQNFFAGNIKKTFSVKEPKQAPTWCAKLASGSQAEGNSTHEPLVTASVW